MNIKGFTTAFKLHELKYMKCNLEIVYRSSSIFKKVFIVAEFFLENLNGLERDKELV